MVGIGFVEDHVAFALAQFVFEGLPFFFHGVSCGVPLYLKNDLTFVNYRIFGYGFDGGKDSQPSIWTSVRKMG